MSSERSRVVAPDSSAGAAQPTAEASAVPSYASTVRCAGCGLEVAPEVGPPFRCPAAPPPASASAPAPAANPRDDIDHLLAIALDLKDDRFPVAGDDQPFLRYRRLQHSWRLARRRGVSDAEYVDRVSDLDHRVARVWGHGMRPARWHTLASPPGAARRRFALDETGAVAGSHKARHLFGIAIYLELAADLGLSAPSSASPPPLAIASCGNAALAAAVVARALDRALDVYVPPWAEPGLLGELRQLGARVVLCPREPDAPPGDPCERAFAAAVAGGAVPFACQGPHAGLTIDGGKTLGFELAARLTSSAAHDAPWRLAIQVGGGALASAVMQGLAIARQLGALAHLPRLHLVQTSGGHPLERAWRRVAGHALDLLRAEPAPRSPNNRDHRDNSAKTDDVGRINRRARALAHQLAAHTAIDAVAAEAAIAAAMNHARRHRGQYMWPWQPAPTSVASGILDDETYDWAALVGATLGTGGWPIVVPDATIVAATEDVVAELGIAASATGAAGVAGLDMLDSLDAPNTPKPADQPHPDAAAQAPEAYPETYREPCDVALLTGIDRAAASRAAQPTSPP